MRRILNQLPEFYLLIILLLGAYKPPLSFNSVLLGLAIVVAAQAVYKKRIPGLILSSFFFIGNLLFLMALLSEFRGLTIHNDEAMQLLVVGASIFFFNGLMSIIMMLKYLGVYNGILKTEYSTH